MNGRHAVTDRPTYPEVKETHGEDPARYLAVDEDDPEDDHPLALAHARIEAIDTLELLKAWQRIEADNWGRREVMSHLDKRERELTGEPIAAEPEPTPVPATDGGTVATTPDSETDEPTEPDDVHPDTKGLVAGEVLVLEHADRTDYIFPATPESDEPYLLRAFDGDDERTAEPIGLTFDEVAKRIDGEHDPRSVDEIDVRAPKLAATNGGDSE